MRAVYKYLHSYILSLYIYGELNHLKIIMNAKFLTDCVAAFYVLGALIKLTN